MQLRGCQQLLCTESYIPLCYCTTNYCIMGIIHERKCSQIDSQEMFVNGDILREYTTVSPLAMPIFPTKVATVKALQSSMHQCSSYSGHTHLELLGRVITSKTF